MARKTPAATAPSSPSAVTIRHPIKAAALLYSAPSYILRGPIYMMFITLVSMLVYSIIATTDTLVVAPVKLQRQTITVQAVGGGLIEVLEVGENTVLRPGSPIATIQEKIRAAATPEQEQINRQLRDYEDRLSELRRNTEFRRRQLESQRDELARGLSTGGEALQNQIGQLQNQLRVAERNKAGAEEDVSNKQAELARKQPLCANRDIPRVTCEQLQQQISDLRRSVNNAQADIDNIRLQIQTAQQKHRQQADRSTLDRMNADLDKLAADQRREEDQIRERINDLETRREQAQTLVPGVRPGSTKEDRDKVYYTSTVDGIVTATHVQRGALINPGNPIVTVVRNAAPLEARVLVQNKDIGQLKIGQDVQLKYFAYPFQEYGIQNGTIAEISSRPSSQPGEQSLYVVNVALASETIRGPNGIDKPLEIGLEGLAEIKTGARRFIEILFSPAAKFFRAKPEGTDGEPAAASDSAAAS